MQTAALGVVWTSGERDGSPSVFLGISDGAFALSGGHVDDHHALEGCYGNAKARAYPDDRNFAARSGRVAGVLADAEILPSGNGHADGFCSFVVHFTQPYRYSSLFDPNHPQVSFILPLPSSFVTGIKNICHKRTFLKMARLPTIQLDWWRDPKGYHLAENGLLVVRNGARRDELVLCRPLESSQSLFRIFANEATTPEGVLDFVQRYGPLTVYGNDKGDRVGEVIRRAEIMRDTLKWMSTQPRRRMSSEETFFGIGVPLFASLDWDRRSSSPVWKFRPNTLIDGLWLQFAQSMTRGTQIRTCMHCSDLFETGTGTGRRLDAKFCSNEHRIAFNSLKRSKEK